MKILFVSPSWWPQFEFGGPIVANHHLYGKFELQGNEVKICTYLMQWYLTTGFLRNLPLIKNWADVVYLTGCYNFSTLPTLWLCRHHHKPLVWSPRGALQRWDGTRHRWLKAVWEAMCRMIAPKWTILHCTSEQEAKETTRIFSWPIRIVPNGVDVPDMVTRSTPKMPGLRLLYVGRLDRKKHIEDLIAVCTQLPVRLRLIGDGERDYVAHLRKMAEGYDHIEFAGQMPHTQIGEAFDHADLTILASATENFGNSIAESLAHSVPVLASTACPWDLEGHGCGIRVPPNAMSLMTGIAALSGVDLEAMGKKGRAWMEKEFSWTDRAKDMIRVFEFASSRLSAGTLKN